MGQETRRANDLVTPNLSFTLSWVDQKDRERSFRVGPFQTWIGLAFELGIAAAALHDQGVLITTQRAQFFDDEELIPPPEELKEL